MRYSIEEEMRRDLEEAATSDLVFRAINLIETLKENLDDLGEMEGEEIEAISNLNSELVKRAKALEKSEKRLSFN